MQKVFLALGFFIVSIVMLFCNQVHPAKYTLSPYASCPTLGWLGIFLAITISVVIIIKAENKKGWSFYSAAALLLYSSVFIILLPYISGYCFSNWADHLTHVAHIQYICNKGHIVSQEIFCSPSPGNIYPLVHILSAVMSIISGVQPWMVVFFIPVLFYLFFILSSFLLGRLIYTEERIAVFAFLSSTVLFCYYYAEIFPFGYGLLLFPFCLYTFFKYCNDHTVGFGVMAFLLYASMPFMHIISSILLITISLVIFCFNWIASKIIPAGNSSAFSLRGINIIFVAAIVLLVWEWKIPWLWKATVENVANLMTSRHEGKSMVAFANEVFGKLNMDITDRLLLFLTLYGHLAVVMLLAMLSFASIIFLKGKHVRNIQQTTGFMLIFALAVIVQGIDYIRPLTTLTSGRFLYLILALVPVICCYFMALLVFYSPKMKPVVTTILLGIIIIGIISVYPSPSTIRPNSWVSKGEYSLASFFFSHRNPAYTTEGINIHLINIRFKDLFLGPDKERLAGNYEGMPEHFGYGQVRRLGENYQGNAYLPISCFDRIYPRIWPTGKFDEADFARLYHDNSLALVFSNGDNNLWYIKSLQSGGAKN